MAAERITRFFHALADDHEAGDFLLGCLIGNLSLELGGSSEPVRAELVRILDGWNEALTVCVRSGQGGSGDIRDDLDAADLASLLIEAWEGAALHGKVTRSRTAVRPVRSGHRARAAALIFQWPGMAGSSLLLIRRLVIYSQTRPDAQASKDHHDKQLRRTDQPGVTGIRLRARSFTRRTRHHRPTGRFPQPRRSLVAGVRGQHSRQ